MSDLILISRLQVDARVGVPAAERATPQRLLVSLEIGLHARLASASDDLEQTVDYAAVALALKAVAALRPRQLIETLAEDFADAVLQFRQAIQVTVLVEKFVLPDADSVAIRIERYRA